MQADLYAVVGNPIAHSLSPAIHAQFAAQVDEHIDYQKALVAIGGFAEFVEDFAARGGRGLNVTLPFKEDACKFCDTLDPAAEAAGAVNTISLAGEQAQGYNTDGVGLVTDLKHRHGQSLHGRRLLILGAGGATRGVLGPILAQAPADVVIVNRTPARARLLADMFGAAAAATGATLQGFGYAGLESQQAPFDLIINATSASLSGADVPLPSRWLADSFCYDMSYGSNARFRHWAGQHGAVQSVDGLGMLVEQAAAAFTLWRGRQVETEPVYQQLRMTLSGQTGPRA